MKKISAFLMVAIMIFSLAACATTPPENFVLITGGTFEMGSPDTERQKDFHNKNLQ